MKRAIPMPKGFKNKKRLISARNINEKTASVQADMLQKRCFPQSPIVRTVRYTAVQPHKCRDSYRSDRL